MKSNDLVGFESDGYVFNEEFSTKFLYDFHTEVIIILYSKKRFFFFKPNMFEKNRFSSVNNFLIIIRY